MIKKFILAAALAMLFFSGCDRSAEQRGQRPADSVVIRDRSAFSISLATPLSAEDAEIWRNIEERSRNPNRIQFRVATVLHNYNDGHPGRTSRQFLIELKRRLGDGIEIRIFYGGIMGVTADQIVGGLQGQVFEMMDNNVGSFAEYSNAFLPLDVMYLVPNAEAAIKIVNGEPGAIMRQRFLDDTGLLVLGHPKIGMRHVTTARTPVHHPSDLSGLKIRVQNNPLHILGMRQFGAAPTPIAFAELFTALQQGVIDGQENPLTFIWDMNYTEVQGYLTLTNHLFNAGSITVNNAWFNTLHPDVRQAFHESIRIAEIYSANELFRVEHALLEQISRELEVTELTPDQFNQFRTLSMQAWDEAIDRMGRAYFEQISAAIDRILAE